MQPESSRSYRGRSAAERRADRRARFLEAGLIVFADKGYAQSTVTDVCAEAGLSRRQFYEEFSDRESLLVTIYDRIQADARAAIESALATGRTGSLDEIAATTMTAYVTAVGADPRRAKIAFVEIVGINEKIERHRLRQRLVWGELLEAVARSLDGARTPPGGYLLAGSAFIGAVNGLVHQWSLTEPRQPVADLVDILSTILVALLT